MMKTAALKAICLFFYLDVVLLACQRAELVTPTRTRDTSDATPIGPTSIMTTAPPPANTKMIATLVPSAIPLSPAATPHPEEWLAFIERDFRGRESHPNLSIIYRADTAIGFIRQDGSGLLQPKMFEPFHSMVEYSLVWSPNGNYLLFDWSDFSPTMSRNPVIHIADALRRKVTLVDSNEAWVVPSWSPDSKWFVTSLRTTVTGQDGKEQDTYNLFRVNSDTSQKDRITTSPSGDLYPSWSPDGQWIAFLRYTPGSLTPKPGTGQECGPTPDFFSGCNFADLYVVHSEGGDPVLLLKSVYIHMDRDKRDSVYNNPSWSPDSKGLVVLTGKQQPDITLINIETKEAQVLAAHPAFDIYPSWSPDGSNLAFVSDREGNEEIYLFSQDRNALINLTNNGGNDFNPVWSPSGSHIAFLSDREEPRAYKLYVMNSDGTNQHEVYDDYVFTRPAWFPLTGVDLKKFFNLENE